MVSSARARHHRWRVLVLAALPGALLVTTTANAAPPPAPRTGDAASLSVLPSEMSVVDRQEAPKSPTSRVAETDPELLGRTDATPTPVMIKLDHDSVATYAGTITGLPATSPSVTGRDLAATSSAEHAYDQYIAQTEAAFTQELAAAVPEATVGASFRTVDGGVSAVVPANRIGDVLALPAVVAVQQDKLEQLLTDSSPSFIGATSLYPQLGGNTKAGHGVIIGVLDSGAWAEHPSFADEGNLQAPPPRRDGTPRTCEFGDNPLTPAPDVFACNNKLIEGEDFLATYCAVVTDPPEVYPTTARDSNGHGTHTASTSAGNVLASAEVLGVDRGPIGGVAPGGHVAVYKVCGALGCFQSDSAAAVAEAIREGVKVINFSISGGQNPRTDPVELAFLDAYTAGVFVAASAGNSGPGAATTDHLSPWVTTVAASTQTRQFQSALTVTREDGAAATFTGSTVTQGIDEDTPVVFPLPDDKNQPDPLCLSQQPAGTYTGVIVACQRGPNRVLKGFTVFNAGAAGMILYNVDRPQTEMTDNHWLPTVHIDEGDEFLEFAEAPEH